VKAPTLILPVRAQRSPLRATSREIGLFVPPEALFPDLEATEATMVALLGTLSRDAVLLACARLNTVVSGPGQPDHKPQQERAIGLICDGNNLRRINAFTAAHPGSGLPSVFFRGAASRIDALGRALLPCPWRFPALVSRSLFAIRGPLCP
jgi:hypothetical protein